ncbi:cysteine desulfurase NifS [Christensenellaceae bacterium OttesenSCG-928-K19]|nr:cysteine desulfurase NifS [Christensenellaceae bacterium OttesenSCG-928-K19]
MDKLIYLDNAATTRTRPEVAEAMAPYFSEYYGNPSSFYTLAHKSAAAIKEARDIIVESIGAQKYDDPEKYDVYFTAGGTEADNWALIATAEAYQDKGKHIITSAVEHHAVLHSCQYLEKRGFEVTYVGVDKDGIIKLDELEKAIREDTILISVMFANNEIGTLQPVKEIGAIAKEHGVLFHTDAVQAYCQVPIDVDKMNIDMMSASAHKLYGPKGIGFLYIRKGIKTKSFIHGGAQERGRRAGTENVPGIVGFGKAVEIALANMEQRAKEEMELRDHLIKRVTTEIEEVSLNGCQKSRLPGNTNFSVRFVESESLLLDLMSKGICASSGSACTTKSLDPSHVLLACGISHERANGSLRMTIGAYNTKEEIDYTVDCLKEIVKRIRGLSPLYEDYLKKNK